MAKKTAPRRKDASTDSNFANGTYPGERIVATFEYNELSLMRASELLAPRLRSALTFVNFALLIIIVLIAMTLGNRAWLPLVLLFAGSVIVLYASRNWSKLQLAYARSTNLRLDGGSVQYCVVVCDDAIHVEDENGGVTTYNLSELRGIHENPDMILARFPSKRYVLIPRTALSEGRFRELSRILNEKLAH